MLVEGLRKTSVDYSESDVNMLGYGITAAMAGQVEAGGRGAIQSVFDNIVAIDVLHLCFALNAETYSDICAAERSNQGEAGSHDIANILRRRQKPPASTTSRGHRRLLSPRSRFLSFPFTTFLCGVASLSSIASHGD